MIDNIILFKNDTIYSAFDDDELIKNTGLDVNQINNAQSNSIVDSNRAGVTSTT